MLRSEFLFYCSELIRGKSGGGAELRGSSAALSRSARRSASSFSRDFSEMIMGEALQTRDFGGVFFGLPVKTIPYWAFASACSQVFQESSTNRGEKIRNQLELVPAGPGPWNFACDRERSSSVAPIPHFLSWWTLNFLERPF